MFIALFFVFAIIGPIASAAEITSTCNCGKDPATDVKQTFSGVDRATAFSQLTTYINQCQSLGAAYVTCSVKEGSSDVLVITEASTSTALGEIQVLNVLPDDLSGPQYKGTCTCTQPTAGATPVISGPLSFQTPDELKAFFSQTIQSCYVSPGNKATLTCSGTEAGVPLYSINATAIADANQQLTESTVKPVDLTPTKPKTTPEPEPVIAAKLDNPLGTTDVSTIIGRIIKFIVGISGSFALMMFVYGGFLWLLSGGNPQWIDKGKSAIKYSVLGLAIIFSSYIIVRVIVGAVSRLQG